MSPSAEAIRPLRLSSIVHVNDKGGRFGGTEEYMALVTGALAERGVRSHLVCGRLGGAPPPFFDSVHLVEGLAERIPDPATSAAVLDAVEALDPDVVMLHNLFDPAVVVALAARSRRGPLLWYVHDHFTSCLSELRWRTDHGACRERLGPGCLRAVAAGRCVVRQTQGPLGPRDLAQRQALRDTQGLVDGIVVVSDYMRSVLVAEAPALEPAVHLLPRPVRHSGPRPTSRRTDPSARARVTFAGRIAPEKGLHVLLEALGALPDGAPVEVDVAGVVEHAGYRDHCLLLEQRAVASRAGLTVRHHGELDYQATDHLLRRSDIVAVPSQWPEPLGAVALEAMSAGAAVAVSDIGGLASYVVHDRSGLLVEPASVAEWTRALDHLVHRPDVAASLGDVARQQVRHLTPAVHIDALDELLRTGISP